MKYVLQNIVLPDKKICDETKLYFRCDNGVQLINNSLFFDKNSECEFSTYFNSFSLNKWLEYTNLTNLCLCLKLKGHFLINVYTTYWYKRHVIKECIISDVYESEELKEICLTVPTGHGDNVYFSITSLTDENIFVGGFYGMDVADETSMHKVEIDLVMCTYKREAFIKKNIQLLKENFFDGDSYNAAGHYHIKVVDNGQTLIADEIESNDGNIKLYPNLNVGGSGGFARGLIESLKENKATHVLFMDDDVLIQMEALERTYNLLRIIKDEYRDAYLAGAMLRLDMKYVQHESAAAFKENYLVSYKQNLNLKSYANVLFNEKYESTDGTYGAWWYCCMPKKMLGLDNLPYPFFVRMDDMEYSLRSPKTWMTLNGISVWHEAFDRKYSTLMEDYFMLRNFLVVNAVHKELPLRWYVVYLLHRFAKEIFRYDYGGAELALDALERYLQGPEFFQTVDTVEDLKQHAKKQVKMQPLKNIANADRLYGAFKADLKSKMKPENHLKKLIRFITINGHLLPSCLLKDFGYAEYGYTGNSRNYFRRKKILGCDLNFENGVILEMSRSKFFSLVFRYIKLNFILICRFSSLRKKYKETYAYMTSIDFWEKYLRLN